MLNAQLHRYGHTIALALNNGSEAHTFYMQKEMAVKVSEALLSGVVDIEIFEFSNSEYKPTTINQQ